MYRTKYSINVTNRNRAQLLEFLNAEKDKQTFICKYNYFSFTRIWKSETAASGYVEEMWVRFEFFDSDQVYTKYKRIANQLGLMSRSPFVEIEVVECSMHPIVPQDTLVVIDEASPVPDNAYDFAVWGSDNEVPC